MMTCIGILMAVVDESAFARVVEYIYFPISFIVVMSFTSKCTQLSQNCLFLIKSF